jgi:methionyl-tRNA formyltransferase
MIKIVVATVRPWNIRRARALKARLGRSAAVTVIDKPAGLTRQRLERLRPDYVFFPHWSWIIPAEIYDNFECVVFHMTDLPFGRGGSPLQNLILRGLRRTKVSAIRVAKDLDAGPVYLKLPVTLRGSAQQIYERVSELVFDRMIPEILRRRPVPRHQKGCPVFFARRKPAESRLPEFKTLKDAYDFIRMLDAEGYPPAFAEAGALRTEFRNARLVKGGLKAEVLFRPGEKQ